METTSLQLRERLEHFVKGLVLVRGRSAGNAVAKSVAYSRVHSDRLFKRAYGETPTALRRRFSMERAAEQLATSTAPVWKIATECGFASSEPFVRAFKKNFRLSPTEYRRLGSQSTWLPSQNTFHYWKGMIVATMRKGNTTMNIAKLMTNHDLALTSTILDAALTLDDAQLDTPLDRPLQLLKFEETENTLRDVLDRMVFTKEVWLSAMKGRGWNHDRTATTQAIVDRWKKVEPEFRELVADLEREDRWDDLFVDALCTPPETFSFGSVIAHIVTFNAVRRTVALQELRKHGRDLGEGDPIDWYRSRPEFAGR